MDDVGRRRLRQHFILSRGEVTADRHPTRGAVRGRRLAVGSRRRGARARKSPNGSSPTRMSRRSPSSALLLSRSRSTHLGRTASVSSEAERRTICSASPMPTWTLLPDLIGSCFGSAGQRCLPGACWWRSAIDATGRRRRCLHPLGRRTQAGRRPGRPATLCPVVNPIEEKRSGPRSNEECAEGARLPRRPLRPCPQAAGCSSDRRSSTGRDPGDVRRPGGRFLARW